MRGIMISIKPEWVKKILNGEKTIEIRKTRPNIELPCEVYIYCTKGMKGLYDNHNKITCTSDKYFLDPFGYDKPPLLNRKVVAEFILNKVEEFDYFYSPAMAISGYRNQNNEMLPYNKCCLKKEEIVKYADDGQLLPKPVFAWNIDNLKIYNKPKKLSDFKKADWQQIINKLEYMGCDELYCNSQVNTTMCLDDAECDYNCCPSVIMKCYITQLKIAMNV